MSAFGAVTPMSRVVASPRMRVVDTADFIDAPGVAGLLGSFYSNSVGMDQHRYVHMSIPIVELGEGRCEAWMVGEMLAWHANGGHRE